MIHQKKGFDLLFNLSYLWTQSRFLKLAYLAITLHSAIASFKQKNRNFRRKKIKMQRYNERSQEKVKNKCILMHK